jgi:deoxyribodipyrimidine photo-lyase
MWFRRDLRLSDNPALLDAAAGDGEVLPLRESLDRYERIRP